MKNPRSNTRVTPLSPLQSPPSIHNIISKTVPQVPNIPVNTSDNVAENVTRCLYEMRQEPSPLISHETSPDGEQSTFSNRAATRGGSPWKHATAPAHIYTTRTEESSAAHVDDDGTDVEMGMCSSDESGSDEDNKREKENVSGVVQEVARLFPWESELNLIRKATIKRWCIIILIVVIHSSNTLNIQF